MDLVSKWKDILGIRYHWSVLLSPKEIRIGSNPIIKTTIVYHPITGECGSNNKDVKEKQNHVSFKSFQGYENQDYITISTTLSIVQLSLTFLVVHEI